MRVGTLLNTFKVIPKILYDLYGSETDVMNKAAWFLQHSPKVFLHWMTKVLQMTELPEERFDIKKFFDGMDLPAQIRELRQAGATHFELSGDLVFLLPQMENWWREQLPYLASLRNEGITYSVHLPQFAGLNPDSYLAGVRSGAVLEIRRINEFFTPLDPQYALHLGGERFFRYLDTHLVNPALERELKTVLGSDSYLEKLKVKSAKLLIQELMKFTKGFVIERVVDQNVLRSLREIQEFMPIEKICLENLEYIDFDAVMASLMPHIPASVCLDTGHLTIQKWHEYPACYEQFFARYGERIRQLHIHNVIKISEEVFDEQTKEPVIQDHKPLNVKGGLLPVRKILQLVRDTERRTGRDIPLVVELYYHDPLPSVRYLASEIGKL